MSQNNLLQAKEFETLVHKSVVMAMQKGYSIVRGTYGDPRSKKVDIFTAIALRKCQPSELIDNPEHNHWQAGKIRRAVKEATLELLGKNIKSFQYDAFMSGLNNKQYQDYLLTAQEFYESGKRLANLHDILSKRG